MFGNLFKGKAKEAMNQFSGNKDFLEGMCAACALTAASEGGIDDGEYEKTLTVIRSNTAIAKGFNSTEIESVFGRMQTKTTTRSGKAELKNEIREVIARDKSGALGQAIVLAALDVADEGGISPAEVAVMRDIASICGVNYDKLAA
ncbi:TerB [Mesorhizobium sp. M0189]|uniref:tellurite resistance TerB family protein n=1 Tax=Mesorhizobium sp. M0189 TaxID=2956909 RepID=UPI0033361B35